MRVRLVCQVAVLCGCLSVDLIGWCASVLLGLLICLGYGLFGVMLNLVVGMLLWGVVLLPFVGVLLLFAVLGSYVLCCVCCLAGCLGGCVFVNSVVIAYILSICCVCLVVLVCLIC